MITQDILHAMHWASRQRKWKALIQIHGKRVHLGYFDDKQAAAAAYAAAAEQLFGDFARP